MSKKSILIACILTLVIGFIFVMDYIKEYSSDKVNISQLYTVYLQGKNIGIIEDEEELYSLINDEQQEIKDEYSVNYVYPPSDLDVIKTNTYEEKITNVNDVYNEIENKDDFTLKGYTVTIKSQKEDGTTENVYVNVLDKSVFDDAINKYINAFIDAAMYTSYIDGTQTELTDVGQIIEDMFFSETLSIKESFISVHDKIYTDVDELTQYLVFDNDSEFISYTVQAGDTIPSIAEANKLNVQEFLIANPNFREQNNLLVLDSKVNVTLPSPVLTFSYEVKSIVEVETDFVNKTELDESKSYGYEKVTSPGEKGLEKQTQTYLVTNGLKSQEIEILSREVLKSPVDQITVIGPTYVTGGTGNTTFGSYIYTGLDFAFPVLPGAFVTSPFAEWRWGERHTGTDFSGTGSQSPIYAIADGVVTQAADTRDTSGTYVVISHGNNYYSTYLHMYRGSLRVSVGDRVSKGQQIGGMGSTGWSTGTHLHLGFSIGEPYTNTPVTYYDPYKIIYGG